MNNIELRNITYSSGSIAFPEYENLLTQAEFIASHVVTMEVNNDTIKETKKTLANLNKAVKELNDRRISIKREMMKPYDKFHEQVKEIEKVIKEADDIVRSQVRELEEKEREEKKLLIKEEWDKRTSRISYKDLLNFDNFLTPQHLNKSVSMNKVLEDMGQFLSQVDTDYQVLLDMDDELAISLYFELYDLGNSLARAKAHRQEMDRVRQVAEDVEEDFEFIDDEVEEELKAVITITDDVDKAIELLEKNNINFELRWI